MKKMLLIVVLVALYAYYNPIRIDREIPLVEVSYGKQGVISETQIHFSGSKYKRAFRDSYFVGTVSIGDTKIESARFNLNSLDVLGGRIDNSECANSFASIYVNSSFNEVTLLVFENGGWSTYEGIVLTGPVENHNEAVDLINKHFQTDFVLSNDQYK